MNDNTRPRVYALPVRLHVDCTLFILAIDHDHAQRVAALVDLQDYFGFDTTHLTTDGEGLLRIEDVLTSPLHVTTTDLTQLTPQEYPPNTHPDFLDIPHR